MTRHLGFRFKIYHRINVKKQPHVFHAVIRTGIEASDTILFTEDQLIQDSLTMTEKIMSPDFLSVSPETQWQNASINIASDLRNQMNLVQSFIPAQQLPKEQISNTSLSM
jgi:hypothetical protein